MTAIGGADTPNGVGTINETSGHSGAAPSRARETTDKFQGRNEQLRQQWLACTRRIKEAQACGDTDGETRARRERDQVGNEFVEHNSGLAVHNASAFLIKGAENSKDHLQAAMLGLWEAFVGLDPDKVDDVVVTDEGTLRPATGWDPDKATFATFASRYISGRARRSVKTVESAYAGLSYNTWTDKPRVDQARIALATKLGRTPTNAEVAKAAGVTEATVRACTTGTPVSLQRPVGSTDGDTTLGDLLADTAENADLGDLPVVEEATLVACAQRMSTIDLMALLLRTGITGRPALTVNRTADKLGIGRGAAQLSLKRAQAEIDQAHARESRVNLTTLLT